MKIGLLLSQPLGQSLGTDARITALLEGFRSLGIGTVVYAPGGPEESGRCDEARVPVSGPIVDVLRSRLAESVARRLISAPLLGNLLFSDDLLVRAHVKAVARQLVPLLADVDAVQAEQQLAALAAVQAGRQAGKPIVADLHGVWSEELVALGSIRRNGRAYRTIRGMEEELFAKADHILVVSPEMKEFLVSEFRADSPRITVVPNTASPKVPQTRGVRMPRRVVFAGMLSRLQNIRLIVDSMAIVARQVPDVEFYLTNKGELSRQVRRVCRRQNLPVRFFWFSEESRFFAFLASCDVALLPAMVNLDPRVGYPSKFFAYLSVGLPIVANRSGFWSDLIERDQIGVVTNGTPTSFAGGIVSLLRDPSFVEACGRRGLALLQSKLSIATTTESLGKVYSQIRTHQVPPATRGRFSVHGTRRVRDDEDSDGHETVLRALR